MSSAMSCCKVENKKHSNDIIPQKRENKNEHIPNIFKLSSVVYFKKETYFFQ